jgi:protoheme IX farnesyltransferase
MNKVETPTSPMTGNPALLDGQYPVSLLSDVKALVKIGIVNSNLMTIFTGFWLALYFTDARFLANLDLFILTMSGSGLVIAGGCVLNNWYDVDIDPAMVRTKDRPTVTGRIPLKTVLTMGLTFTGIGLLLLSFTTLAATLYAFLGWFIYVVLYTVWSKRRYTLNTAIGSFSGAMPPVIGWTAVDSSLHVIPIVLFILMFIWQTPHFLALAMKKCKDYKAAGVPMLPAVYGFNIAKRQIVIYIACLLPLPFYLVSLGSTFVAIATMLNAGWLAMSISGFFMKSDIKWANMIFIYSLFYLMIMFLSMIIVTIDFPFS